MANQGKNAFRHKDDVLTSAILRDFDENNDAETNKDVELPVVIHPHHSSTLPSITMPLLPQEIWKPRGLTLSAFRRPENSIKITDADPSRRIETDYDLWRSGKSGVLGHGAFSTVRLAVRKRDQKMVAVKTIAKHEALRSRRLRRAHTKSGYYLEEWEILRKLKDHPHVIDLLDVFESNEEIQLVTEFCSGGELFDVIQKVRKLTTSQAALIVAQVLEALVDIHASGIVHKDVKPENILLTKPFGVGPISVKLCDFGVARPLVDALDEDVSPLTPPSRSRSFSMIGTDYYAAPELSTEASYSTAVDIYSLGVTLYIMLCGFPPIFTNTGIAVNGDDDESITMVEEVVFPESYWHGIAEGAKQLLRRMLHSEPNERITAAEASENAWLQSCLIPAATTPPSPNVDLDLVRSQLYKLESMTSSPLRRRSLALSPRRKKRKASIRSPSPRRRRAERRTSTAALVALADLCRGVDPGMISAAASVTGETAPPAEEARFHQSSSPVATLSF